MKFVHGRTSLAFVVALAAVMSAGCGSESAQSQSTRSSILFQRQQQGFLSDPWHGYYSGSVDTGASVRYAEALLTPDGQLRMFVGGPGGDAFDLQNAAMVVGEVSVDPIKGRLFGGGVIIGQGCERFPENDFCGLPRPAEISFSGTSLFALLGHVEGAVGAAEELSWSVAVVGRSRAYPAPASISEVYGQYVETLAEFAREGDTLFNVNGSGRMFFQSPGTGCTGNGQLLPKDPGSSTSVFSVAFSIGACDEPYARVNGDYDGLATYSVEPFPSEDAWLILWLVDDETSRAITMRGAQRL